VTKALEILRAETRVAMMECGGRVKEITPALLEGSDARDW
jgi:hypothetical protein